MAEPNTHWIVDMVVEPGKLEEFKTLMAEMVVSAKAEPGVLDYEWFLGADGRTVSIHERYRDAQASADHSAKFREKYAPKFFALAKPGKFVFLGEVTAERRARINADVQVLPQIGGFSRHDK